jgi:glycine/D-amino acid oxidase-like deaminating enzyme
MNLSYWERNTWLHNIDYAVIGSGIVGLNCALALREKRPNAKIVIFERGMLPSGASTKNAGFACFGSISELLADLRNHTEEEVISLVRDRYNGLRELRNTLGDQMIDFQPHGGYELFSQQDAERYERCLDKVPYINLLLKEVFFDKTDVFSVKNDPFGFKNIQKQLIFNRYEGQLDTGKMMMALLKKAAEKGIFLLNSAEITSITSKNGEINLVLNNSEEIKAKTVCVATNGFAKQFLEETVAPARAQVLITEPIANLPLRGTFHIDEGYYYFRNIHNRILLGGGRNLDREGETTTQFGLTNQIQERLEELLRTTIVPGIDVAIAQRWSGIMGVGSQKKPIVKEVAPNIFCGVRLGGMGVAIGTTVGGKLADLALD